MVYGQPRLDTPYALLPRTPVWADALLQFSSEEQKAIINAFNKPEAAQASGIRLANQKFFTLQCDKEHLYGKKGASTAEMIGPTTTFG